MPGVAKRRMQARHDTLIHSVQRIDCLNDSVREAATFAAPFGRSNTADGSAPQTGTLYSSVKIEHDVDPRP